MKIDDDLMRRIASDLGLNTRYEKGLSIPVRNCWHFMTDGNAVEALFCDDEDFRFGMNLIYVLTVDTVVTVLAFTLMDTHVHFVLYGNFFECNRMIHEYVRRLSIYLANKYSIHGLLSKDPVQFQVVEDDNYLKTVICYVLKNAPVAGLPFNAWDYPWSSGSLYFRHTGYWNSFNLLSKTQDIHFSGREVTRLFHSKSAARCSNVSEEGIKMVGDIVFPGEYVAWEIVEKIFRTNRSYNYFLCRAKELEVDSKGGAISYLTIPQQEMRQHKKEICLELFGEETIKNLDTSQRIKLAKTLKSRYNSSKKQILRLCGLVYSEAEHLI